MKREVEEEEVEGEEGEGQEWNAFKAKRVFEETETTKGQTDESNMR